MKRKDWGDVKFLHYRAWNNGALSPKGGATVAYVEDGDGIIRYSIAWCNEVDRYNKGYGRQKAAGRLLSTNHAWKVNSASRSDFIGNTDVFMSHRERYRLPTAVIQALADLEEII